MTSEQSTDDTERFEVGVEGMGGDYEHIVVEAESPEKAYRKAERNAENSVHYSLEGPVNAYQAFEIEAGVTHEP